MINPEAVVEAVIHNQAIDAGIEGSRAPWLIRMLDAANAFDSIRDAIYAENLVVRDWFHLAQHVDFLVEFHRRGDTAAVPALWALYHHIEETSRYRSYAMDGLRETTGVDLREEGPNVFRTDPRREWTLETMRFGQGISWSRTASEAQLAEAVRRLETSADLDRIRSWCRIFTYREFDAAVPVLSGLVFHDDAVVAGAAAWSLASQRGPRPREVLEALINEERALGEPLLQLMKQHQRPGDLARLAEKPVPDFGDDPEDAYDFWNDMRDVLTSEGSEPSPYFERRLIDEAPGAWTRSKVLIHLAEQGRLDPVLAEEAKHDSFEATRAYFLKK